jgi:hypothetical protein
MNAPAKVKTEEATPIPIPDIHARMVAVMRDLGAIGKDKNNAAQGFKYRGIDDVYNAINPVLARHGVYMTAEIIGKTREERTNAKGTVLAFTCLHMRYRFIAEDGTFIETQAEGEGMDSGDKSSNKAMAVAHKYALLQAFCIPTQDLDDPDAHVHEVAAKNGKPVPQTQRDAIHTPMQPVQDDADVQEGVKNWVLKEKGKIATLTRLPDLLMWKDEREAELHRLLKKAPEQHKDLMAYYQNVFTLISKKETQ